MDNTSPRLLDQLRSACRLRHFSRRTEEAYCHWTRRFIVFHGKRHPSALAGPEVTQFLASLANDHRVSASTQNQALCALLFLYRIVLKCPLPDNLEVPRRADATPPPRSAHPDRNPRRDGPAARCPAPRGLPPLRRRPASDGRLPSIRNMEDVAWVLRTDNRTKKIGFVRTRDLKPADRFVLSDDDWS